ncbi:MAG: ParB/RepB/Spo0J family partition protein [Ruminococcus sp.]|nr:ParB/RepB/Spo0J family partition protein [Ruminococcus sp.]MCM1380369.1 ParB/RepB/Spo0J family partition protein [Muribaculaceae bacterium]MCM1478321.1 ParB/RepB/Spo0J family partition protein [Muribaculaceae bacterium]
MEKKELTYIDMLKKRYPKVNETDDWFDGYYCPGELFESDKVPLPYQHNGICNSFDEVGNACQECWKSICPAPEKCCDKDTEGFETEYQNNTDDEEKPKPADDPPEISAPGNTLVNIPVDEIEPHPNNPRKDVGDVSELVESIKKNGIMQNLTVIPHEGKYRCLIGHRRLAAAKIAGLEQVPCVIAENIPLVEQIAIMLSENIQRNDLTKIEQLDGMQMMIDLGDTADGISEKTGLSESTVRRRLKLLEYGRDKIVQAFEQGATFGDFEKLNSISDPKKREKVAKKIGTVNFNWAYENAVSEEKRQAAFEKAKETVKSYAAEITEDEAERLDLCYCDNVTPWRAESFEKHADAGSVKYFCNIEDKFIKIYRERTPEEIQTREQRQKETETAAKEREREKQILSELDKLTCIATRLRRDFIKNCDPLKGCTSQKDKLERYKLMSGFLLRAAVLTSYGNEIDFADFLDYIGFDDTEDYGSIEEKNLAVTEHIQNLHNGDIKSILALVAAMLGNNYDMRYYETYGFNSGTYKPCPELDFLYEVLTALGYEMSDEEKQLQDGTHELFGRVENET